MPGKVVMSQTSTTGSAQTPQHLSLDLHLSLSSVSVPPAVLSLGVKRQQDTGVLEEQVSSSTSKAPEALSSLGDAHDSNIPKGSGHQKGIFCSLAALLGLGQGLSRH